MTSLQGRYEIDTILPIGKPGRPRSSGFAELAIVDGHPALYWAALEAIEAGSRRIILAAPQGHPEADTIAGILRESIQGICRERGFSDAELVLLFVDRCDVLGWDGLVTAALRQARGETALLIDVTVCLADPYRVSSSAATMLVSETAEGDGVPLIAMSHVPWEESLTMPCFVDAPGSGGLDYDRAGSGDTVAVFSGRAVFPVADLILSTGGYQSDELFPFEAFCQSLLRAGARTMDIHMRQKMP